MSKLSGLGGRLYSGETSFNFVGNRRRWYSISAIFILASIGALAIQGLHLGIEFKGGSSYTVNKSGISVEQARASVANVGIEGVDGDCVTVTIARALHRIRRVAPSRG